MRISGIVCFISLILFHFSGYSQKVDSSTANTPTISLHALTQFGAIRGEKERVVLTIQIINGIAFRSWFAGIGAGVDDYEYRSIPLFIDVRKDLTGNGTNFFLYADGGINFPWQYKKEEEMSINVFRRDLYTDLGIGHRFKINNRNALMLSAGYSIKKLKKETTGFYYVNGQKILDRPNSYYYAFKRVLFKIGFQF